MGRAPFSHSCYEARLRRQAPAGPAPSGPRAEHGSPTGKNAGGRRSRPGSPFSPPGPPSPPPGSRLGARWMGRAGRCAARRCAARAQGRALAPRSAAPRRAPFLRTFLLLSHGRRGERQPQTLRAAGSPSLLSPFIFIAFLIVVLVSVDAEGSHPAGVPTGARPALLNDEPYSAHGRSEALLYRSCSKKIDLGRTLMAAFLPPLAEGEMHSTAKVLGGRRDAPLKPAATCARRP